MLYQVTYSSNELRVKAYMYLPEGCIISSPCHKQETEERVGTCSTDLLNDVKLQLLASRYPPKQTKNNMQKRWPVLIYCRGGLGNYGGVKTAWVEQFAHKGYIVFAPSYRGNEGSEGRDEYGGHDIEDVRAAYRLVQALPYADSTRIRLWDSPAGPSTPSIQPPSSTKAPIMYINLCFGAVLPMSNGHIMNERI
ncbi:hypothetical protein [Paenibacillus sp. ACRRY]|uniref:alpha/beta hydrolase family protein n=1 Tax=Paenibacillus sp. ACRRY TaxID=2918208 RepID=UPI001EF6F4F2|nr:hypothetical protein [Paenibacillus sp. ACRRY]